jgi:hypothetical protein
MECDGRSAKGTTARRTPLLFGLKDARGEAQIKMPTRRETLVLGASATVGALAAGGRAFAAAEIRQLPTLQTRLFNFKEETSPETQSEIVARLKLLMSSPGVDSLMVGRNFIPTPFPSRFEWMYMFQPGDLAAPDARAARLAFDHVTKALASHCRNAVACDLRSPFPAKFADGAGVKVRHTVMFGFKDDASPEARERNVAAIRDMGKLPMVQRYFVEPTAASASSDSPMQWQVIGDFGSVDDYWAYSRAPVHLAIREDFKSNTSRVAFIDVKL